MDVNTISSMLGALGIGSLLAQALAQGRDRRSTRTDVLGALEDCELARWVTDMTESKSLISATRRLESAAVISGLPSRAVDQYIVLAWAGYWTSYEDMEDAHFSDRDPEYAGGIPAQLNDLIADAARDVSRLVWSPWRGRLIASRGVRERTAGIAALIAHGEGPNPGDADLRVVARSLRRAQRSKARHRS